MTVLSTLRFQFKYRVTLTVDDIALVDNYIGATRVTESYLCERRCALYVLYITDLIMPRSTLKVENN